MTAPIIMPGLHPDLPREVYDSIDAVNQSSLKVLVNETPADYEWSLRNREPASYEMQLGSATHLAVYEPARFATDVLFSPKFDRRTKQGKADSEAFEAAAGGKLVLEREDYDLIGAIQQAIAGHKAASRLIASPGARELTAVWKDEETGVLCKGRLDQLTANHVGIIDLKTARDGIEKFFSSEMEKRGYHIQGAFYIDGVKACSGSEAAFCMIVVDKERVLKHGHKAVCVYEMAAPAVELGRIVYRRALATIAECRASGEWPCFPSSIQPINVPAYSLRRENIETGEEMFQ